MKKTELTELELEQINGGTGETDELEIMIREDIRCENCWNNFDPKSGKYKCNVIDAFTIQCPICGHRYSDPR